jgi:D-hydroxyproline dehydrogenase subunit beta
MVTERYHSQPITAQRSVGDHLRYRAMPKYDLIVVGAGIVGLAHALAAARRGLRVALVERDAQAAGASVRNFGFVTVSGQAGGDTRRRALRSREVWAQVAAQAGIEVAQRGAVVVARREEALAVLEEFAADPMGRGCEIWDARDTAKRLPGVRGDCAGALASPHELRVEAREALPRIALWLQERHGVAFTWGSAALAFDGTSLRHARGSLDGEALVIAAGAGLAALAPELAAQVRMRHCKLQMMRLAGIGVRLPSVLMSDLSLIRYEGFATQPGAALLRARLERECAGQLAHGIHLIVAQGGDGSLVVGDSHHYGEAVDETASAQVDELILEELRALLDLRETSVIERWIGHYPVADVQPLVSKALAPRVRAVMVTSGTGMSTAFAIGEETIAQLFD